MKRPHHLIRGALAAAAAVLLSATTPTLAGKGGGQKPPPPPPPPIYKFTDLGQPVFANGGGAPSYDVTEPDEFGELLIVGGGIATPSPASATVWEATAGGVVSVSTVSNSQQGRAAVNEAGMIAFYGYSASKAARVGMVSLPGVGTVEFLTSDYRPQAINNFGEVVLTWNGWGSYLWTLNEDGTTSDLVQLKDFYAYDINDAGLMAGQQISTAAAAIAWLDAGVLQVQALPGLIPGNKGRATAINNLGEVVGFSSSGPPTSSGLPFLWSATAGLVALNPNNQSGAAMDINDNGQVVGWSTGNGPWYAWLWKGGKFSNLNVLSGVGTSSFGLETAEAINDAGQIVGRSTTYDKKGLPTGNATYLLTPNP